MTAIPRVAQPETVAPRFTESVWRSPLVPVALFASAGIVIDRFLVVPFAFSLFTGACALAAFVFAHLGGFSRLALVYLAAGCVSFGAAHHHLHRHLRRDDDVSRYAGEVPVPVFLRGAVDEGVRRLPAPDEADPLRSQQQAGVASCVLRVASFRQGSRERAASGRVRLLVTGGTLTSLFPGDQVEVHGRLARVAGPANPGEFDAASYWRDRGVGAVLVVPNEAGAIRRARTGWHGSFRGWLARLREAGHRQFERHLGGTKVHGVARALVLGEGAPMGAEHWGKYVRTGVVHVLAISGQHLVTVGTFLWFFLHRLGMPQRRAAALVAFVLVAYALFSGGRPPAMRAAVVSCAVSGALLLGYATTPANLFALAWIAVILPQPSDVFDQGCQLSFLAAAVLTWASPWLTHAEQDPLDAELLRTRPVWFRLLHALGQAALTSYLVNVVVWLAILPLVAFHSGILPPAALPLGPVLNLAATVALAAGFALLLFSWLPPAAWLASWAVWLPLAACEWLVELADAGRTHVFTGPVPAWWLIGLYLALFAALTGRLAGAFKRWLLVPGAGWLGLGLLGAGMPHADPELRCTFLSVGHGGCVVIETPDGRTLLYDVGSMSGPELAATRLAPYLWSRGIFSLDAVILSHADLDHFNGLPSLLESFRVRCVLHSTTFDVRETPAVGRVWAALEKHRVVRETVHAGDRLDVGEVVLDVLHPPANLAAGTQNARSVVVAVRHSGRVVLLTGDLEGPGLDLLLRTRRVRADVLQAPHHGSAALDAEGLLRWCTPREIVSCQGPPRGRGVLHPAYADLGERFRSTYDHGAVTVRCGRDELFVETFRTGRRTQSSR